MISTRMPRLPVLARGSKLGDVTGHPRILLVEDDPLLREAVRLLLEDAGYLVEEAGTAAQAVHSFETVRPSLVLLDLGLPDRSGLDLVRELKPREEARDVTFVALTGRAGSDEKRRCLEAGCREVMVKPVDGRTLLQKLPSLIRPAS